MIRARLLIAILLLVFLFPHPASAVTDPSGTGRLQESLQVFTKIMLDPKTTIPPVLLQKASAIAILPNMMKASFLFGGRYGKGVLMVKDKNGNWSNPVLISLSGGSFGLQMGIQSSDLVLVFRRSRALDAKSKGNFIMGADVFIVAGRLSFQMDETTEANLQTEIYSFSRSIGLNAGFALQGSSLRIDEVATSNLYTKAGLSAMDILSGKVDTVPAGVLRFKEGFTKLAGKVQ